MFNAMHPEVVRAPLGAPGRELAQVQGVGVTGQAPVAGKEPREPQALALPKVASTASSAVEVVMVITGPPGDGEGPRSPRAEAPADTDGHA